MAATGIVRARLAAAVGFTLSRRRRAAVSRAVGSIVERLEERIVFGVSNGFPNNGAPGAANASNITDPIRAFDGTVLLTTTDLQSDAFGSQFGITRSWTGLDTASPVGNGWMVESLPFVEVAGGDYSGFPTGTTYDSPSSFPTGSYPDDRLQVVTGGTSPDVFSIISGSSYQSYPAWGGQPLGLTMTRDQCLTPRNLWMKAA